MLSRTPRLGRRPRLQPITAVSRQLCLVLIAVLLLTTHACALPAALPSPADLYRAMTAADRKAFDSGKDITAANPSANIRPEQHQSGVKSSQYISTTSDPNVAEEFNRGGHGIVKINTDKLDNKQSNVDMAKYAKQNPDKFLLSYQEKAAKEKEVLVQGKIPRNACTLHACGATASTKKADLKAKAQAATTVSLLKAAAQKRAEKAAAAKAAGGSGTGATAGSSKPRTAANTTPNTTKARGSGAGPSTRAPAVSGGGGGGGSKATRSASPSGAGGSPKKQPQQQQQQQQRPQLTKAKSFGGTTGASKPAATLGKSKSFSEGTKPKPQNAAVKQQSTAQTSSPVKQKTAGGGGKVGKKFRGSSARAGL
ncbi:hypothetical protein DFJ73DRAFT_773365 [Zopfochytrium polystomum]|nr:hypothetical protein DFJ73DRAFT_773365 [Zopfochytrium polystomum]